MDILDGLSHPTKVEWSKLYDRKKAAFDQLQLETTQTSFNFLDIHNAYYGIELNKSVTEYNNRTFDLINNYILLAYYYEQGIPDEEWYVSPGKRGGVQYFPHFKESDYTKFYWFSFYTESYYARFYGVLDSIYHLLNARHRMDLKPRIGFNKEVLKTLRRIDTNLYGYLKRLPENKVLIEVNEYRNNFVHNLRPNQIDMGLIKKVREDGAISISSSVGNYTTTSSFIDNIEKSIDLLVDINIKLGENN